MAEKPPRLNVTITPRALRDLDEIWEWNAEHYDIDHADAYTSFLLEEASKLGVNYPLAKSVLTAPEFFYSTLPKSRRKQSHHHLAVFQVEEGTVEVLRFYHSRQDWQKRFAEER